MKNLIIVPFLLFVHAMSGQNNPIFFGGSGDGWSRSSHMPASNTTMNHGGNGDGWSQASHMSVSNVTMYHGDSSDGYAMQNFYPVTSSPSNYGNIGDGWAKNSHAPALTQTLYKGGEGDGWASNVIPLGPLPIELLSFTGQEVEGTHLLKWTTSMELNSSHFVVEHSVNASSFSELGMVTAAGNSHAELHYSFPNKKPVAGNNYYRLKLVDIDQQYKYSNVVLLRLLKDNSSLMVYPNPAANVLNIEMSGMEEGTALKVEVLDAGGKLVRSEQYQYANRKYTLDIAAYSNGLYFLKITGNNYSELVKFSISK